MAIVTDKQYYMNNTLKANLDILKQKIRQDWYFIILITGSNRVRIGKTTIGEQIAYYLDPTFSFDSVTFDPKDVREISLKLGKHKVVFYDEAKAGLDSKRAMESMQKELLDFLAAAGQLNQFLIIILPDYFELKKEIATSQSICLINCHTPKNKFFERGKFAMYNLEEKNRLYYWGKKQGGNYWAIKPSVLGDFRDFQVLDKKKYCDLKQKSLLEGRKYSKEEERERSLNTWKTKSEVLRKARDRLITFCYNKLDIRQQQLSDLTKLTPQHIFRICGKKNA